MKNIVFLALLGFTPSAFAAPPAPAPAPAPYTRAEGRSVLRELVGAKDDAQAARRLAVFEAMAGAPLDALRLIPGFAPTDAERLAADLPSFVNPGNANVWIPFEDLQVGTPGPDAALRRTLNTLDDLSREFGVGFSWLYGTRLQLTGDSVMVEEPEGALLTFRKDGKGVFRGVTGQWVEKRGDAWLRFFPSDGVVERFEKGRLVERKTADGFATKVVRDGDGRPTAIVASNGRRIALKMDGNGRIVEARTALQSMTYRYDGQRLVETESNGLKTVYTWNAQGLLATIVFPQKEVLELAYTEHGWISSVRIDKEIVHARFTVDASNPTIHGAELTHNGETTRYEYREAQGATRIVYPNGNVEVRIIDPSCGCVATDSLNGQVTSYAYDKQKRLASVSVGNEGTVTMDYSDRGLSKTRVTSNGQDQLALEFDVQGHIVKAQRPGMRTATYEYRDGLLQTVRLDDDVVRTLGYDAKQDVVRIADMLGQVLEIQYDEDGRPLKLRKNAMVTTELRYEAGKVVPSVRTSLRGYAKTTTQVLAQDDLEFFFGDAARVGKRASLDDLPGVRLAGPVVLGAACTTWDFFKCQYGITMGCLILDIANTVIPLGGLFNPFVFNPKTEEFEPNGLYAIWKDYQEGKLTAEQTGMVGKDAISLIINGSPIDGIGPKGFFEWIAAAKKDDVMKLMKIWIRQNRPANGKLADELIKRLDDLDAATGKGKKWKIFGQVFDGAFAAFDVIKLGMKAKECSDYASKLAAEGGCD